MSITPASASTSRPTTATSTYNTSLTCTGARRRTDAGLAGQLNAEWTALLDDAGTDRTVRSWSTRHEALAGCADLSAVEQAVAAGPASRTDGILLALLRLAQDGDALAGRTVLQFMLGKAIRIAASYSGRDTRENLEHTAVTALWTTIATYPTARRREKVAANIAMDTLRAVSLEFAPGRSETPTEPSTLAAVLAAPEGAQGGGDRPADLELLELLAWAVDHHVTTAADATLIIDIYAPAPGSEGGAAAAARHGLSWAAARQRASRAVRKITVAIRADALAAA